MLHVGVERTTNREKCMKMLCCGVRFSSFFSAEERSVDRGGAGDGGW